MKNKSINSFNIIEIELKIKNSPKYFSSKNIFNSEQNTNNNNLNDIIFFIYILVITWPVLQLTRHL